MDMVLMAELRPFLLVQSWLAMRAKLVSEMMLVARHFAKALRTAPLSAAAGSSKPLGPVMAAWTLAEKALSKHSSQASAK